MEKMDVREKLVELQKDGKQYDEIAEMTGVSVSYIHHIINKPNVYPLAEKTRAKIEQRLKRNRIE